VILSLSTAIQFRLFVFSAVLTAVERLDIASLIGIITRILSAVGFVTVLGTGGGLVSLCAVILAANALDYGLRAIVARQLVPQLRPSQRLGQWRDLRALATFGAWNSLVTAGVRLIAYGSTLVVGLVFPLTAVARFAIANSLVQQFQSIFVPVGHAYYPSAARLDAQGDSASLKRLYLRGSRLLWTASLSLGVTCMLCAEDFCRLWLGDRLAADSRAASIAGLTIVLLAGGIAGSSQRIGYQMLTALGHVRLLAGLLLAEAVCHVVLILSFAMASGLMGGAIGIALASALFEGILHPAVVCQKLEIRCGEYAREVLATPIPFLAAVLLPLLAMRHFISVESWFGFILKSTAIATVSLSPFYFSIKSESTDFNRLKRLLAHPRPA
jgi:O-antigen/teichoic acid export membrane protein